MHLSIHDFTSYSINQARQMSFDQFRSAGFTIFSRILQVIWTMLSCELISMQYTNNSEIVSILYVFPFISTEISRLKYLENHAMTGNSVFQVCCNTPPTHFCLFMLITMMFLFTVTGRGLLILLILVDHHLHILIIFSFGSSLSLTSSSHVPLSPG